MRLYPGIRAEMGNWHYYIVRMRMREIAHEVDLAHDIYEDNTLSDAIQRSLNSVRVNKQIVGYLALREDRFFSSIVVAAMGGRPRWNPVTIDEDVIPPVIAESRSLKDSFGVLSFDEDPKYYALDGQHRVAAIKMLVEGTADLEPPANFDNDFLSVLVINREDHSISEEEWMRRYRRMFSSLNRYAKPTDKDTNIIMDEDDLFAILTRRLITDHEFFQAPGRERDSFKVQTEGKNLKSNSPHFTSLQTLYDANKTLLTTRHRQANGWFSDGKKIDEQICPDEDFIDSCYNELSAYWTDVLKALPMLRDNPPNMRVHDVVDETALPEDHLLFWPIGQLLLARLVRRILDDKFPAGYNEIEHQNHGFNTLEPLKKFPWELHRPPWKYLLLVPADPSSETRWRMRSEERKQALEIAYRLLLWFAGVENVSQEDEEELRNDWENLLHISSPEKHAIEKMWEEVLATRENVINLRNA